MWLQHRNLRNMFLARVAEMADNFPMVSMPWLARTHLIGGPKDSPRDSMVALQLQRSGRMKSSPANRPLPPAAAASPAAPILMNKAFASGDHLTRLRSLLACSDTLSGDPALPVPAKQVRGREMKCDTQLNETHSSKSLSTQNLRHLENDPWE